ncbi:MAG: hypothetical protein AAFY76_10380 [Cyanobacteria bacterium J06649_11]
MTAEPVSPVAGGDEQSVQTTPKKPKAKVVTNGEGMATFECTEANCQKRYKNKNGLQYHQRTAHTKKMDSFEEKVKIFLTQRENREKREGTNVVLNRIPFEESSF